MDTDREFVIKKDESVVLPDGLTITNRGGGHKILMDRSDLPFAELELKCKDETKKVMLLAPQQGRHHNETTWKGYAIILIEQDFRGAYSKLLVRKAAVRQEGMRLDRDGPM